MKLLAKDIEENRLRYLARIEVYKRHGYDQEASREFILAQAGIFDPPILEIGTGKGHLTVCLAKRMEKITTVDISDEEQIFAALNAAAADVLDRIEFMVSDAAQLRFPDRSFGMVISANAFHHFERPFSVLKEMIRVCWDKLVIADFNRDGFSIIRQIHREEGGEHEEQAGDFNIVGAYLKEQGFDVKKADGFYQVVYVARRKERS